MKKLFIIIFAVILCFMTGCTGNSGNKAQETIADREEHNEQMAVTICVNGKDITNGNLYLYDSKGKHAEIPLLAVFSELGADITEKNNDKYEITYGDKIVKLSLKEKDFGVPVPPGTVNGVRKTVNDEIIMDSTSANVLTKSLFDMNIIVDYSTLVVYIGPNNS